MSGSGSQSGLDPESEMGSGPVQVTVSTTVPGSGSGSGSGSGLTTVLATVLEPGSGLEPEMRSVRAQVEQLDSHHPIACQTRTVAATVRN